MITTAAPIVTANGEPHDGNTATHHDVVATLFDVLDLSSATTFAVNMGSPTMNAATGTATFTANTNGTINPTIMVNGASGCRLLSA